MSILKRLGAALLLLGYGMAHGAGYPLVTQALQDEDGVWRVIAHNQGKAPVLVVIELKNQVNARSSMSNAGAQKVLEPGAKETMAVAIPTDAALPLSFDYDVKWVFGRGSVRGEHTGLYRTPFPGDLTFETINSAGDVHLGARLGKAVDIVMPEGTPVIAARDGYVMDVRGERGGDKVTSDNFPFYEEKSKDRMGNYVRILHDDGTWAEYLHLKDNSVRVAIGAKVEAGTQIAESGATGVVNKPHLHFMVMKPQNGMTEPTSQTIKMELPGRGVMIVKAGEAIGAGVSVSADAQTTTRDPLVIAPIEGNRKDSKSGVYQSAAQLVEKIDWVKTGLLIAALVAAASAGGFVVLRNKKGQERSWREFYSELGANRRIKNAEREEEADIAVRAKDNPRKRPEVGYLIADEERALADSVGLCLQIGYEVHCKVSMNRLIARPLSARDSAEVYGILRGESIDFAIVRQKDKRIVCALDLVGWEGTTEVGKEVAEMKALMLSRLGIEHQLVSIEAGPDEIRSKISEFASARMEAEHLFGKMRATA